MGVKSLGGNNTAGQWVCGHSLHQLFLCVTHMLGVYWQSVLVYRNEMYNRLCQSGTRYSTILTVSVIFSLSLKEVFYAH